LYLLERDNPCPQWAPFAGHAPLSDLRVGVWAIAARCARALGTATPAGIAAAHASGSRATGAVPVMAQADLRGSAWVVDATFAPRIPMRPAGAARRLLHDGRTVAWRLDAGEQWSGPNDQGDGVVVD